MSTNKKRTLLPSLCRSVIRTFNSPPAERFDASKGRRVSSLAFGVNEDERQIRAGARARGRTPAVPVGPVALVGSLTTLQ